MAGVKSMNKYDKMIERNRKISEDKVASAKMAIRQMVMEQERVSVPKLMKLTGLSRGFFYKNSTVRNELEHAMEQQAGLVDPRRTIINQAMEKQMELLQQEYQKIKKENENLKKENLRLKKALNKKELNIIKNL